MSSIYDLFGDIGLNDETGGAPFDPSKLDDVINDLMKDRPVPGAPEGYVPSAPQLPVPTGEGAGADGGVGQGVAPPAAPAPLPPPVTLPDPGLTPTLPPAAPDLFSGMTDLERAELLALRQALADPERQGAVRRAYLGVETASPAAPAPPEPPAKATLPVEVDPDSFEAQLWRQNQALQDRLDQLTQVTTQQTQQTEAQLAQAAARKVTGEFSARYGDKLSAEEIQAVCSLAGAQKLPEAFLPTVGGNLEAAMTKSLEFVLRSNDTLLAKVLGAPPAPVAPVGTHTPEAAGRQRKLTALSSAASPSGDVPQRQPLQHRPDGRLDESSRASLIATMMGKLNEGEN